MCVVCGCSTKPEPGAHPAHHHHGVKAGAAELHYGSGAAGSSVVGLSQERIVKMEADVLGSNQRIANRNRAHFFAHGISAYNMVSSPGSGKTTLLCATVEALKRRAPELPMAVIEGDQQTALDADRIRATGAAAIQVNTGRGCHLDAQMVSEAFAQLDLHSHAHAHAHDHGHDGVEALLFIENVGNLVCPALWDLGETAKVVILSTTEGEDKPLKYPDMFAAARLMVINKTDLLPYVSFDVARCIEYARRINPGIEVLQVSATQGQGMDAWIDWLLHGRDHESTAPH